MQITKVVTRKDALEALATEDLRRGHWFGRSYDITKKCSVCAVGAVLRKVSFEKWAIEKNLSSNEVAYKLVEFPSKPFTISEEATEEDIKGLLGIKNYLGALSAYFETGHNRYECMEFVAEHFPKSFKLTVRIR